MIHEYNITWNDIPVYQDELDAYIESTFDLSDELDSILQVTSDNNPKLHNYENLDDVAGMTDLDKSMTNKLQDWNNNYLYEREVEYILYAGKKLVCLSYSDYLRMFVTIQYRSKHLLLRP